MNRFHPKLAFWRQKLFGTHIELRGIKRLYELKKNFTLVERVIYAVFFTIFIVSVFFLAAHAYNLLVVPVPTNGGIYREGVVAIPKFLNPALALTEADRDLNTLVFSSLIRFNEEGKVVGDLAESWDISSDGLSYTFTLKKDARFHDGIPVTADDVIFTLDRIKDPMTNSPLRPTFEGVNAEVVNTYTVKFTLREPYAPFLDTLTVGIIPKHVWENVPAAQMTWSKYNTEPIGSGPYQFAGYTVDNGGIPTTYFFNAFRDGHRAPYINNLEIHFYTTIENALTALQRNEVDGVQGVPSEKTKELQTAGFDIHTQTLPRIYALFINQNHNALLAKPEIREALSAAIDRRLLISSIYGGNAAAIYDPFGIATSSGHGTSTMSGVLERNGFSKNTAGIYERVRRGQATDTLAFSIAAPNTPELKAMATLVKESWEKEGAEVTLSLYETADLQRNVIRPRNFDILLFGQFYSRTPDPYPFWHSSQRNDPGLNISQYVNRESDTAIEVIRQTPDTQARNRSLLTLVQNLQEDRPAIFLVNPYFIYAMRPTVQDVTLPKRLASSERLSMIDTWYVATERIWNFLAK